MFRRLAAYLLFAPLIAVQALAEDTPLAGRDGNQVFAQIAHAEAIECVALIDGGQTAISGDSNGAIKEWETESGRLVRTIPADDPYVDGIHGFHLSPHESLLFYETRFQVEESLGLAPKFIDLRTGRHLKFDIGEDEFYDGYPIFSDDERFVYLASAEQPLEFDAQRVFAIQGDLLHPHADAPPDFVASVRVKLKSIADATKKGSDVFVSGNATAQGVKRRELLLGGQDDTTNCGSPYADPPAKLSARIAETSVSRNASGKGLALSIGPNTSDTDSTSTIAGTVAVDVTPDFKLLVSGHSDGTIRIWDAATGSQTATVTLSELPIVDVKLVKSAYTNGERLEAYALGASGDRMEVRRADLRTGEQSVVFEGSGNFIKHVETNGDGSLILVQHLGVDENTGAMAVVVDVPKKRKITVFASADDASPQGLARLASRERKLLYGGRSYDIPATAKKFSLVTTVMRDTIEPPKVVKSLRDLYGYLATRQPEADSIYVESLGLQITSFLFQAECCNGGLLVTGAKDSVVKALASGLDLKSVSKVKMKLPEASPNLSVEGLLGLVGKDILVVAEGRTVSFVKLDTMDVLGKEDLHTDNISSLSRLEGSNRFVSAGEDGAVTIWEWREKRLVQLTSMYALPDGQWLAMTRDGFFRGSKGAGKFVNAVHNGKVVSIDQLYDALARSDLVEALLQGDPTREYEKAAGDLDLDKVLNSGPAPELHLVHQELVKDGAAISLVIGLADRGGGIGKIEWRVNTITQGVETRGATDIAADATIEKTIDLAEGRNEIEVFAYNAAGLVKSEAFSLPVDGTARTGHGGRLFVLTAGINDYQYPGYRLVRARDDAIAISQRISQSATGMFESIHTKTLLDGEVTRSNLEKTFAELAGVIRPEDKFVFFLAGHGTTVKGQYFFIGQNFNPSQGRDFDATAIPQDEWQKWFAGIKARASLLIYDTCDSGASTRGTESQQQAFDKLSEAVGRNVLSATSDDGGAIDNYEGHGLFTYALLQSFSKGDVDRDNYININEMAMYAGSVVPQISKSNSALIQRPWSRIEADFPIGAKVDETVDYRDEVAPDAVTHFLSAEAPVFPSPDGTGSQISRLGAHDGVYVFDGPGDFAKVARKGHVLGYVNKAVLQKLN